MEKTLVIKVSTNPSPTNKDTRYKVEMDGFVAFGSKPTGALNDLFRALKEAKYFEEEQQSLAKGDMRNVKKR